MKLYYLINVGKDGKKYTNYYLELENGKVIAIRCAFANDYLTLANQVINGTIEPLPIKK